LYDGFGLVLTEAMICGVPCVAFDCECGPSEIIRQSYDGFLVQVKNEVELAEKMKMLMNDDNLRGQMGTLAKKDVLRFSPDAVMGKWNKYFSEIITRN
jgi:glycosyltransferase involved in cell wall biosynthesis